MSEDYEHQGQVMRGTEGSFQVGNCKACGAMVVESRQPHHTEWHHWLEDVAAG